jgi:hypothetical protein
MKSSKVWKPELVMEASLFLKCVYSNTKLDKFQPYGGVTWLVQYSSNAKANEITRSANRGHVYCDRFIISM